MVCKCCLLPINKEQAPLCKHSKELQFLGFGFPLWYQFLKMCMLLLFLSIASYNAMSFRQALQNNYGFCFQGKDPPSRLLAGGQKACYTIFIQSARIQSTLSNYQQVLRIISWTVHLIGLMYIRNRLVKLDKYYNERTPTFVDFALIVKGLPQVNGIQNTLRKFFRQQFTQPFQIEQITLLPKYPQLQQLQKQKQKIINNLRKYYDKYQNQSQFDQKGKHHLLQLKQNQKNIYQVALESQRLADRDQLVTQKVIVIFNRMRQKQIIRKQFANISKQTKKQYFGQNYNKVYLLTAPQPQQMIWQNVNLSYSDRVLRILASFILSIIVLVGIFISIFFILQQKSYKLGNAIYQYASDGGVSAHITSQYRQAIALVYVALFLIVTFNKTIMSILYHKFTDFQRHSTTSKYQFSFGLKLTFGFFFTTAVMTLAVEDVKFDNYFYHQYGVIDQQSVMFFINSFYIPLFWIINPLRIIKLIKQKIYYGKKSFTQRQANLLMEDDNYQMGKRFAQIIQTMWFTFMYSTLLPLGAIITFVGISIYYWVDKYNLLRRSTVTRQVSGTLILSFLNLLDFTLFLKPMGSMIFDAHLKNGLFVPSSLVMMIIGAVYVILPKNWILKKIDNQKFRMHIKTYQQLKPTQLQNTYNTEHPVVKVVHYQKIKAKMSRKGLTIDDQKSNRNSSMQTFSPQKQNSRDKTNQIINGNLGSSSTLRPINSPTSATRMGSDVLIGGF